MYILILCQHYRGKLQLVQEHGGLTSFAYSSERVNAENNQEGLPMMIRPTTFNVV